jgi:hypothetical protein
MSGSRRKPGSLGPIVAGGPGALTTTAATMSNSSDPDPPSSVATAKTTIFAAPTPPPPRVVSDQSLDCFPAALRFQTLVGRQLHKCHAARHY